jgi:hypothetical protein
MPLGLQQRHIAAGSGHPVSLLRDYIPRDPAFSGSTEARPTSI